MRWRFALRPGWGRKAPRWRRPMRPLHQGQSKRDASLKRHTWLRSRSWSRITSGVLLSVRGAVPVRHLQSLLQHRAPL